MLPRTSSWATAGRPVVQLDRRRWLGCGLSIVATAALVERCAATAPDDEPPAKDAKEKPAQLPRFGQQNLDGWRVLDQFVFRRHGEVKITDGVVSLGKGDPGTGIAWSGAEPPLNNYDVTLEARRLDGDDFFCGLTFPVDKSHCTLIVGGWGGSVTGLSNIDDFPAVENETTGAVEIERNRWHKIRLKVTPREILAWFDAAKIVDLDARGKRYSVWWEQETARPFGLTTWNTAAELRNLKVVRL